MKIVKIDQSTLDVAVDYTVNYTQHYNQMSFPVMNDEMIIRKEYNWCVFEEHAEVVGCFSQGKCKGIMAYFTKPKDAYCQTVAFFVDDHLVAHLFLEYLNDTVKSFKKYIGISGNYQSAITALSNEKYAIIENTTSYRLNVTEFETITDSDISRVKRIDENDLDDYLDFHNHYFTDIYWTADKIEKRFKFWNLYAIKENNIIESGLFALVNDDKGEVFGMRATDQSQAVELLNTAIEDLKNRYPKLKTVYYFENIKNEFNVEAIKMVGFKEIYNYLLFEK